MRYLNHVFCHFQAPPSLAHWQRTVPYTTLLYCTVHCTVHCTVQCTTVHLVQYENTTLPLFLGPRNSRHNTGYFLYLMAFKKNEAGSHYSLTTVRFLVIISQIILYHVVFSNA